MRIGNGTGKGWDGIFINNEYIGMCSFRAYAVLCVQRNLSITIVPILLNINSEQSFKWTNGDNLHEMSNLFSGINKTTISICCLLKFLPRVLSVKEVKRSFQANIIQ